MRYSNIRMIDLKIGITVLIGLVIFFFFIITIGTETNLFSKNYELKVFVTDIEGLADGSMVTLGGLKVGTVDKMEFVNRNGKTGIDIILSIKNNYKPQITEHSTATIKTIGLLGDRYVDIAIGQPSERPLEEGQYLTLKPSFSLETFATNLGNNLDSSMRDFSSLMADLKIITSDINAGRGTLGRLIKSSATVDELDRFVASMNGVTRAITERRGLLGKSIYDPGIYNQLSDAANNLNVISDSLYKGRGSLGKLLVDNSLYDNLNSVSTKMNSLLEKTEGNSTVGKLVGTDEMYKELIALIAEFKKLVNDVKQQPSKYFHISIF
jgi:phospholipid/cholesterol/gamma-HCH transport system substrate-binding protein